MRCLKNDGSIGLAVLTLKSDLSLINAYDVNFGSIFFQISDV